ncbi:hypothetical protein EMIHUDRAFT_208925 [Emiliania huxleyi CCMP1516]|uniref:Uncharacterized protein n=2 Tax=Emiliania huxleyi TaxID=2903 RepID=A0A0D3J9B2_EMIH1|nr:hypothetical protein EMIHUDRAFT_208925 [Emiliania huxleyi CCMP1516]EOD20097.1 hypothetical protein EMIHUDRAFT_208925 [Emiliania huxleyi CCMP1516]|eukprot:XP_005772526.1 hypothetical protein EMIHUDRAFT_208925 [Emiliania huxleyi CCMP1516]
MRSLRRCRAVIFDLDDTLVPTSKIDRAAILHAAALASGDELPAVVAARFSELLKAEPFPPEPSGLDVPAWRTGLWERALSGSSSDGRAGASPAARQAYEAWSSERLSSFRFADDVDAMVRRLQSAGYKTGVLTNGHADVQRAKTAACGAGSLFGEERVIIAGAGDASTATVARARPLMGGCGPLGEHAEQKPHASIFRVASATLMVGDSYAADVAGGINASLLATVWVRPPLEPPETGAQGSLMHGHLSAVPAGQPSPTFTVESVLEVEACLEKIG